MELGICWRVELMAVKASAGTNLTKFSRPDFPCDDPIEFN
jgi:hypothetical protein